MKSLFLVSLPRSLSTHVYHQIRKRLGLSEPTWTSDGEILNLDRNALLPEEGAVQGEKFLTREADDRRFGRLLDFLDQVVVVEDFVYKDVVQPFILAEWLPGARVNVLRIERPVADVAFSMLEQGWVYPRVVADQRIDDKVTAVVDGLLRAQRALKMLPVVSLHYDDLVEGEDALVGALRTLGYGDRLQGTEYLDEDFRNVRREVLKRRQTPRYLEIERTVCRLSRTT